MVSGDISSEFSVVSFETARLLKKLQPSEEALFHYVWDGGDARLVFFGCPKKSVSAGIYETFCAPSRERVLRTVRDKAGILISAVPPSAGPKNRNAAAYIWRMYSVPGGPGGGTNKTAPKELPVCRQVFNTQEDAAEAGIQEAVRLLLSKKTTWD